MSGSFEASIAQPKAAKTVAKNEKEEDYRGKLFTYQRSHKILPKMQ